jgi:hypothetical protein
VGCLPLLFVLQKLLQRLSRRWQGCPLRLRPGRLRWIWLLEFMPTDRTRKDAVASFMVAPPLQKTRDKRGNLSKYSNGF